MADPAMVVDLGRQALVVSLMVSGPLLFGGLVVGLAVGIFQAVTQIHEMTLTFIPKILTIMGIMLALMPWMILKLMDFTIGLIGQIPVLIAH